jgi:dihydroorotate dehydrogenase (fumarate)
MDLSTDYLGLSLPHPLMPGASPLVDDMDMVRRLEDAGAAAIVMHSLFEEQITPPAGGSSGVAASFPGGYEFRLGPAPYLEQVRRIAAAVNVPVIASLNGTTAEGWLEYARLMQDAGADALELNIYRLAADPSESGAEVERRLIDMVGAVTDNVAIPVAVKLSPYYSSLSHLARELRDAGADGLVLFNRFHQPDLDPEMLLAPARLKLSTPDELLLRTRWLAILSGQLPISLAATGGVHSGEDAIKAILAGAHAVQLVSALIEHGPEHLAVVRREVSHWLDAREYDSLRDAQSAARAFRASDPEASERGSYLRMLQSWRV